MVAEDTNDLAAFLEKGPRHGARTCWVCTEVPAELRAEIEATISRGKEYRRWRGIARWLEGKGLEVPVGQMAARIEYHFLAKHHEGR